MTRTGVTAASASGGYNSSGWPTGALDASKYISIKLTAPSGCALTASSVSVALEASSNGPGNASIATSSDSFASKKTAGVAGTTSNVSVTADIAAGETLEIRVYGYQSVTTGGTLRANSAITVTGSTH